MSKATLLLADDHKMFRQGLRELIERKTDFTVIGEASTGREVLERVAQQPPDLLLLDIQMPEMDGVAVAQELGRTHPNIKIIMLTMYRQDEQIMQAIQAGARGYLLKDADSAELLKVLEKVWQGEVALDPALLNKVFEAMRAQRDEPYREPLTPREKEILALVVEGLDNRGIAARLFLSEKTVGNRLSEIFQKLGVSNRTQAAMLAVQKKLIDDK